MVDGEDVGAVWGMPVGFNVGSGVGPAVGK